MAGICMEPTMSQQDVIDAVDKWKAENSDETLDTVLYFASELTGISVDKIAENMKSN